MRSRDIKRRQGIGRRRFQLPTLPLVPIKRLRLSLPMISQKRAKEAFFRLCVLATVAIVLAIVWRVARPGVNIRVSSDVVGAFNTPHRAISRLREYAQTHHIPFGELLAVYNAENNFFPVQFTNHDLSRLEAHYVAEFPRLLRRYNRRSLAPYAHMYQVLFDEIETFPIPSGWYEEDPSIMFGNSWGVDHNLQGNPTHMGTAVIDRENIRGRVPVVSMTAGVVAEAGWNNQLGYFVGITTANGTYYLYAHLDSIATGLATGQQVTSGQLLGQMGNSGGGRGSQNFAVHLHIGISPDVSFTRGRFWINPYPMLRYLENRD